jgi:plastocyanin
MTIDQEDKMRKAIAAIVVIVILVIGGLVLANKNDNSDNSSTDQPSKGTTNQPAAVSANSVTIKDMAFNPADIKIAKGTKVTWTNNDSTSHTVTENDGQTGPDSDLLSPGQSYSFTFNQAGTFHYHCKIHPEMTGTVTVADTADTSAQPSAQTNPAANSSNAGVNSSDSQSGYPY